MWGWSVDNPYVVYGGFRTGSVPVEATLLLLGEPYEVIETDPLAQRPSDRRLEAINPMRQVPALVLPSGELRMSWGMPPFDSLR